MLLVMIVPGGLQHRVSAGRAGTTALAGRAEETAIAGRAGTHVLNGRVGTNVADGMLVIIINRGRVKMEVDYGDRQTMEPLTLSLRISM